RRHTRSDRDWSSDVCSSDLAATDRSSARRGTRPAPSHSPSLSRAPSLARRTGADNTGAATLSPPGRGTVLKNDLAALAIYGLLFLPLSVYLSRDRKSTRLNSSHDQISYAVFCL